MADLEEIKRPALGCYVGLGTLYNAKTDTFLTGVRIFRSEPQADCIRTVDINRSETTFKYSDDLKEKFNLLDINGELSVSFMAGLFKVSGSGSYLNYKRTSEKKESFALRQKILLKSETLLVNQASLENVYFFDEKQMQNATHFATEVIWGGNCIISAQQKISQSSDNMKIAGSFKAEFEKIAVSVKGGVKADIQVGDIANSSEIEIDICGDGLGADSTASTFAQALELISKMSVNLQTLNAGKGKPISYTLTPINRLPSRIKVKATVAYQELGLENIELMVDIFDKFSTVLRKLNDHVSNLESHAYCISSEDIKQAVNLKQDFKFREIELHQKAGNLIALIRKKEADPNALNALNELFTEFQTGDLSPREMTSKLAKKHEIKISLGLLDS